MQADLPQDRPMMSGSNAAGKTTKNHVVNNHVKIVDHGQDEGYKGRRNSNVGIGYGGERTEFENSEKEGHGLGGKKKRCIFQRLPSAAILLAALVVAVLGLSSFASAVPILAKELEPPGAASMATSTAGDIIPVVKQAASKIEVVQWKVLDNGFSATRSKLKSTKPLATYSNSARKRQLQNQCPTRAALTDDLFGTADVSGSIAEWFDGSPGGDGFVKSLIEIYLDSELSVATGQEIKSGEAPFTPLCKNLPLLDDACYLGTSDEGFLKLLVAKYVPFGDQIIANVKKFEDLVATAEGLVSEEIEKFYKPAETGSCAVLNSDMFGIYETPGFPPPFVYKFCNCVSLKTTGTPACTIQPFFEGIAISTGESNALLFNAPGALLFFDGNVEYELINISGDAWLAFRLLIAPPNLTPLQPINDLVCKPSAGAEKPVSPKKAPFTVELNGKMFIKNDINDESENGGELLILSVIDKFVVNIKGVVQIDVGTFAAALRIRSNNPDCFPSGIFFSGEISPVLTFGPKVSPFLKFIVDPTYVRTIAAGVTWLDRGEVKPDEYLQSFFYKETLPLTFLGIDFDSNLEFQYFHDKEFTRRQNFDTNVCCPEGGEFTNCTIADTGLAKFIRSGDFNPQPTIAFFAQLADMNFFDIIIIEKVELIVIVQLPANQEDFELLVKFASNVKVMDILEIETEVIFAISEDGAFASLSGQVSIDGGDVLGEGMVTVQAKAEIGDYLDNADKNDRAVESKYLSNNTSRDLQVGSLLDADWEVDIDFDYNPPQWLIDVGEGIAKGVQAAGKAIEGAWNEITDFVSKALDEVIAFAAELGENILQIFYAIGDAVADAGEEVDKAINSVAALFENEDMGPIADFLSAVGDVTAFAFDLVVAAVEIATNILSGNFDEIDDVLWDAFSSSDFKREEPSNIVGYLGCTKIYKLYEECLGGDWFGGFNCKEKRNGPYEDQSCVEEKTIILDNLKKTAINGKEKKDCRDRSKMRNQGLSYAAATNADELTSRIAPELSFSNIQLGKASNIKKNGACTPLPYNLRVNTLSPTDPNGFSGGVKVALGNTSQCLDFSSAETLTQTLPRIDDDKDKASEAAKTLVIGDQGTSNDIELQECKNSVDGLENCIPISISEGDEFQSQATISCDVANPNFNNLFGKVEFSKDPRCPDPSQTYKIIEGSPPEVVCGARSMKIERTLEDCCGNTDSYTHLLKIEQVPPKITQVLGSMDVTATCDTNIHPSVYGEPSFNGGCRLANKKVALIQTDPSFNLETCTTTLQRTFTVSENACEEQSQNFVQIITLENNYDPQFDFFPSDKTIGVFDSYGTDAFGFPTAFQQCGLPVEIIYSDDITEGSCFAERVLRRTFRAVDSCGHFTEKVQVLTISNNANSLPLGKISLARLYGQHKLNTNLTEDKNSKASKSSRACIVPSDKCGIYGAPEYKCAKSTKNSKSNKNTDKFADVRKKFAPYQNRLASLHEEHLSKGPIKVTCSCSEGDSSCDKREQQEESSSDLTYFGTSVTTNSGTCDILESANPDNVGKETLNEIDCPIPKMEQKRSKKSAKEESCYEKILTGSNAIYNIFEITANDFHDKTIVITVPPTSVVLVNVIVPVDVVGETIYFAHNRSKGIVLGEGVVAHNLIWNIIDEIDLSLRSRKQGDWSFQGTLLNPYGKMKLKTSKNSPVVWKGQLFAYDINAYKHFEDFQCGGHFAGFASCKNMI